MKIKKLLTRHRKVKNIILFVLFTGLYLLLNTRHELGFVYIGVLLYVKKRL